MGIRIISDGSADLPEQVLKDWDITLVPLSVHFEDGQYDSAMDLRLFYQKMKESSVLPKTSSPAPNEFRKVYQETKEGQDILVISVSSTLSSTYHHALMGREMALEEGCPARSIEVIDSKNASLGLGLIAYKAARLAKEGLPLHEIVQAVRRGITECRNYFVLDTLENVVKGGRLDKVRGKIASVLNIKLLMRASEEGSLELVDKVRGFENAVKKMIDKLEDAGHDLEKRILAIAHSNAEERAKEVLDRILQRYRFKDVIFSEMGPVIGTYAGEGGILVAYI